jgi:hypothetical protein
MASRKNAMLTTEDRRWLTGEKTYDGEHAKQQRYQRRNDIRERVYNSILDFTILFDHLEENERQKLFGEVTDNGTHWNLDDDAFVEGVHDALAFLLYNVGVTAAIRSNETEHQETTVAESVLRDALFRAGRKDDVLVEHVDLDIDATQFSLTNVLTDLEAGEDLSPAALRLLMESDQIETAAVQECIREMVFDDESIGVKTSAQE